MVLTNLTLLGIINNFSVFDSTLFSGGDDNFNSEHTRGLGAKFAISLSFGLLSIVGIAGNLLVIYAILNEPLLQIQNQLSNVAVMQLAISDFCTTSFVSLPAVITVFYDKYPFTSGFCTFCTFCNVVTILATINFLAMVSLDRYILSKYGGIYPTWLTQRIFLYGVVVVWIICILFGVAWTADPIWIEYDYWAGICDVNWIIYGTPDPIHHTIIWCSIIFHAIIPFFAIIGSNIAIIRMARKVSHVKESAAENIGVIFNFGNEQNHEFFMARNTMAEEEQQRHENENRVLKAMLVVLAAYILLTTPVSWTRIIRILGGKTGPYQKLPSFTTTIFTILQFFASVVNPMIYGLLRKDFKLAFIKILNRMSRG